MTKPINNFGFIFNFKGHGSFDPNGKVEVNGQELSQEDINKHNSLLAYREWQNMIKGGSGVLYLLNNGEFVGDWIGENKLNINYSRESFHNMAGKNGRRDVWFRLDGSRWHGVNIGDNNICRVRRTKTGCRI